MTNGKKKAGHRSWAARSGRVPGTHTGDILSPKTRSEVMSRIKGKNTSPERIVVRGLRAMGHRFSRHPKDVPGRPDILFRRLRLAVFIDGDFWHGWRFPLWKHKLSPKWQQKIECNRARDSRNFRLLRANGWTVVRIWEHQIERSAENCVACVATKVTRLQLLHQQALSKPDGDRSFKGTDNG